MLIVNHKHATLLEQTTTMHLLLNRGRMDANIDPQLPIVSAPIAPVDKPGRPKNSINLHSKQPSGIANRLKAAGINWIESFGAAIKANDKQLLTLWLRLLPYLVVTGGHRRVKHFKGRASKAAVKALEDLEAR